MSKLSLALKGLSFEIQQTLRQLGSRIQLARKRRSFTLQETATASALALKTIRDLENGKPSVTVQNLLAVLITFDLGLDIETLAASRQTDEDTGITQEKFELQYKQLETISEKSTLLSFRLGSRLQYRRHSLNLTIKNLADSLYVSPTTIQKLGNDPQKTSLGMLASFLSPLHCLDDFQKVAAPQFDDLALELEIFNAHRRRRIRSS